MGEVIETIFRTPKSSFQQLQEECNFLEREVEELDPIINRLLSRGRNRVAELLIQAQTALNAESGFLWASHFEENPIDLTGFMKPNKAGD